MSAERREPHVVKIFPHPGKGVAAVIEIPTEKSFVDIFDLLEKHYNKPQGEPNKRPATSSQSARTGSEARTTTPGTRSANEGSIPSGSTSKPGSLF